MIAAFTALSGVPHAEWPVTASFRLELSIWLNTFSQRGVEDMPDLMDVPFREIVHLASERFCWPREWMCRDWVDDDR